MTPTIKDLGYLGEDFQARLVKCFFENNKFFMNIRHLIDPNHFTLESLRIITRLMLMHCDDEAGIHLDYFSIETLSSATISDPIRKRSVKDTLEAIKSLPSDNQDLIMTEAEKFFKQQNLTRAINESIGIIKDGNASKYYVIEDKIKRALETNSLNDYGFGIFDHLDADLQENARDVIPTGCPQLDDALYGGLGRGELGLIVSPMGVGKALPLDAPILTPEGWVKMGDVKLGDLVLGCDGEPHVVKGIFPQEGLRPMFRITFADGSTCICDSEHLWAVWDKRTLRVMSTVDIIKTIETQSLSIPVCQPINLNGDDNIESDNGRTSLDFKANCEWALRLPSETRLSMLMESCFGITEKVSTKVLERYVWDVDNEAEANNFRYIAKSCGLNLRLSIHRDTLENRCIWRFHFVNPKRGVAIVKIEAAEPQEAQCISISGKEELYITRDFVVTHNTSVMCGISVGAATAATEDNRFEGYKVLHFFFEDTEPQIRRKYFGRLIDIEACTLCEPGVREVAKRLLTDTNNPELGMVSRNVRAKRLPSGEVTASHVKNLIRRHISRGFKPDLVIIDYFECLKAERMDSNSETEWTKEGITMRKLESICNELNVAMWVPVQSVKSAIGKENVGMEDAGGSVKKTQIGHVVLTLSRTKEQARNDRMNVAIEKLRAARVKTDAFNNIRFNNGTCRFDMSELATADYIDGVLDTQPLYPDEMRQPPLESESTRLTP